MLKLMKYDLKAMLKLWWIAAVACVLIGFVGAGCNRIIYSERQIPSLIVGVAELSLSGVNLCITAFSIVAAIISFGRFYKNFFTDEGYLTFTLPVTKKQLLDSKIVSQMIVSILTWIVTVGSVMLMELLGGLYEYYFGSDVVSSDPMETQDVLWLILYLVEVLGICGLCSLFSVLFTDCCITFGCMIAKKAKLVTSIAVYFGANWVFTGIAWIFAAFGIVSIISWMSTMNPEDHVMFLLVAMMLFCVIAILGLLCSLLYSLMYWMLDRKLNLP